MRDLRPLIVQAPQAREPERRYVVDVVLREWLGLDYELRLEDRADVVLSDAQDGGPTLTLPDVLLSLERASWMTEASLPGPGLGQVVVGAIDGEAGSYFEGLGGPAELPVLYAPAGVGRHAVQRSADGLTVGLDIFGSVFFMITRYEEVVRSRRDSHGRFPLEASLARAEGLVERPIVDEYVDLLWAAIHSLWPWLHRRETAFELSLTHDIDVPWATWRRSAARVIAAAGRDLATRHRAGLAARRLRAGWDARTGRVDRDPYDTFDRLMDTSERHGLSSSFYLLAGNAPGDPDFRYAISDAPVMDLMGRVAARGHELGLHASYSSFDSAERMALEMEALKSAATAAGAQQILGRPSALSAAVSSGHVATPAGRRHRLRLYAGLRRGPRFPCRNVPRLPPLRYPREPIDAPP